MINERRVKAVYKINQQLVLMKRKTNNEGE